MPVYNPNKTQREQFIDMLERGLIPLVCEGDCESISGITPEKLSLNMRDDVKTNLGVHEPCGEKMVVPELKEDE